MTSFKRNQYPNAVIGARYPNAVIWLVPDSNPTLMQQSDWCKQHTTLHANIELFFLNKKRKVNILYTLKLTLTHLEIEGSTL